MNTIYRPLITIIIPTYNHSNYLGKALRSVINQTYENWEIIVVDNYSTDNTETVVINQNDKRIKYFKILNNGIIAKSRNAGIVASKGEWIAFLDSDDWWLPNKLEVCLSNLNDNIDLIYHDLKITSNTRKFFKRRVIKSRQLKKPVLIDLLVKGNAINNSSVIVRKRLLEKIGLINEDRDLIAAEDYNTWLKISKLTNKFLYLQKTLGCYLMHKKGMSQKNMSLPIRHATSEFLTILNNHQKNKLESNIRYASGRFYFLNSEYRKAKRDLLFTSRYGNFHLRLKSLFMILMMILK